MRAEGKKSPFYSRVRERGRIEAKKKKIVPRNVVKRS